MAIPRYNKCTVWSKGVKDPRTGLSSPGETRVYMCEVKIGGNTKFTDRKGSEFYPASTYYVRLSDIVTGTHTTPKEGEMIAKGDHSLITNPSDADAETIRAVKIHDHTKFGETESYTIGTNA